MLHGGGGLLHGLPSMCFAAAAVAAAAAACVQCWLHRSWLSLVSCSAVAQHNPAHLADCSARTVGLTVCWHPCLASCLLRLSDCPGAGAYAAGKMTEEERFDTIRHACPGAGACGGMYTANTMASAIEALGMSLPYSSSIPAEDPLKVDECRMVGR